MVVKVPRWYFFGPAILLAPMVFHGLRAAVLRVHSEQVPEDL